MGNYLTDGLDGLDSHDLAILAVLQDDADQPVAQVAERVRLSQNACWRRIKRLEEDGFIVGRVALLDPRKLKAGLTVFMTIKAAEHSEEWHEALSAAVRRMPEIVDAYRMAGDADCILRLQVEDIAAYDRIYKRLAKAVRIAEVRSAFALEEIKHTTSIALPVKS